MFATLIAAIVVALPATARAQATVQLSFSVTDSAHQQPLSGARVALFGPTVLVGFSDAFGQVQFDIVPAGQYRARISKQGYLPNTTALFTIADAQGLHFDVALGSGALKTIGSIKARPADTDGTTVAASSTLRELVPSLGDALSYLPGVQTSSQAGALITGISIGGHDPAATGLAIDGVPAFSNGSRLNADLFGSLSVSNEPQFGFLGGTVNLRTVDPALAHSSSATAQNAFDGHSAFTALDRGTIGSVGYSALHAERNVANGLLGETFLDTSGLRYPHAGVSRSVGNVGKLRTTLGPNQTLTGVALESHYSEDLVCARQTGALPCGYGPGNRAYGDIRRVQLDDAILSGSTTIRVTAFATQERNTTDFSRRYVGGQPAPSGSIDTILSRGGTFDVRFRPSRHALALSGYVIGKNETLAGMSGGGDAVAASTSSRLALTDSVKVSAGLTARLTTGFAHTAPARANAVYGASLNYVPNGLDRYTFDVTSGDVSATEISGGFVTPPSALTFDCNARSASGSGPGDVRSHPNATTTRAGWSRSTGSYRANVGVYRQTESGTPLAVPVSGAALPLNFFPGGTSYFDDASAAYSRQPGCAPATLAPSDVYVTVPITAARTYQGLNASLALALSPRLALQGAYSVQSATIASRDARLDNPYSYVLTGSQLPNVPLHTASAVVSWRPKNTDALTVVAGARHTSENNANNLPAYTTFSAALDVKLRQGHLQLTADNLTNAFGGTLGTPANAVPLARRGAAPLPTIATPLAPRAVYLTYTMSAGAPLPARIAAPPDQDVSAEISLAPTAFGDPPGTSPFQLDKTNPNCFINEARLAERVLRRIDQAATLAAQERRAHGSGTALSFDGEQDVKLAYREVGDSYAVTVTATSIPALRALASCAYIHNGTRDQEEALGLYLPARGENLDFVYMPNVGLYTPLFVRGGNAKRPGTQTQRFTALPSKPPTDPLKLRAAASCTTALRPAAETYLTALAAFATATPDAAVPAPDGWTFKRRESAGTIWIETTTTDADLRSAVIQCASVAGATQEELTAAGAASAPFPAINYAVRFGLYARLP
ncbi:MAG: hypothetical protein JWM87_3770 [Candidatus Eremiobacteraeota bacterium]|nr:hypothetical protein [Candidatus Eremiobacteraeota bacterium]